MSGRRVLIVGGGIAGLALARMLARIGVWPEVIEREPVWRPAGTGMYLPGNATGALRALGLRRRSRAGPLRSRGSASAITAAGCCARSTSPRSGGPSGHAWRYIEPSSTICCSRRPATCPSASGRPWTA